MMISIMKKGVDQPANCQFWTFDWWELWPAFQLSILIDDDDKNDKIKWEHYVDDILLQLWNNDTISHDSDDFDL